MPRLEEDTCINLTRDIVVFALHPAITAYAKNRLVAAERKKRGGNEAGRALKERRKVVSSRIELESNL